MADQNPNKYLERSVHDLLSLKGRTVVITGGARGLGLAFCLAVAEVGGNVAILDVAHSPHEHLTEIKSRHPVKIEYYKYVWPKRPHYSNRYSFNFLTLYQD